MPTLAATLKMEIRRLAAKEIRKAFRSVRRVQRQMKGLRLSALGQRRTLAKVERRLARLKLRAIGALGPGGGRGPRISPQSIRSLRSRLQMTRKEFAALLGVSQGSIFLWETGRATPRGKSLARIAEVRKMGIRKARLHAQSGAAPRRRPARRGNGRRRRTVRRRRKA